MTIALFGISYDAKDAGAAATFWAAALGRQVDPGATAKSASIPAGTDAAAAPKISFHQVPEGKTVKNRLHLDLITGDFDAELVRLEDLGAAETATYDAWTTLQDPDGNEFDLIRG